MVRDVGEAVAQALLQRIWIECKHGATPLVFVVPAKAGTQVGILNGEATLLDSCLRRNDDLWKVEVLLQESLSSMLTFNSKLL